MPKQTSKSSGSLTSELGRLLEAARKRASTWLDERKTISAQLSSIRDEAQKLLDELNPREGAGRNAAPGRRRPGRKPGFKLSPAARKKLSDAAKRRWAAQRKADKAAGQAK